MSNEKCIFKLINLRQQVIDNKLNGFGFTENENGFKYVNLINLFQGYFVNG